jgi:hypothetical protein
MHAWLHNLDINKFDGTTGKGPAVNIVSFGDNRDMMPSVMQFGCTVVLIVYQRHLTRWLLWFEMFPNERSKIWLKEKIKRKEKTWGEVG